jgi:hypothetical protein
MKSFSEILREITIVTREDEEFYHVSGLYKKLKVLKPKKYFLTKKYNGLPFPGAIFLSSNKEFCKEFFSFSREGYTHAKKSFYFGEEPNYGFLYTVKLVKNLKIFTDEEDDLQNLVSLLHRTYTEEEFKDFSGHNIDNYINYLKNDRDQDSWELVENALILAALYIYGYDGFMVTENGITNLAIFDTNSIKITKIEKISSNYKGWNKNYEEKDVAFIDDEKRMKTNQHADYLQKIRSEKVKRDQDTLYRAYKKNPEIIIDEIKNLESLDPKGFSDKINYIDEVLFKLLAIYPGDDDFEKFYFGRFKDLKYELMPS